MINLLLAIIRKSTVLQGLSSLCGWVVAVRGRHIAHVVPHQCHVSLVLTQVSVVPLRIGLLVIMNTFDLTKLSLNSLFQALNEVYIHAVAWHDLHWLQIVLTLVCTEICSNSR